jgi:hypothetical protein
MHDQATGGPPLSPDQSAAPPDGQLTKEQVPDKDPDNQQERLRNFLSQAIESDRVLIRTIQDDGIHVDRILQEALAAPELADARVDARLRDISALEQQIVDSHSVVNTLLSAIATISVIALVLGAIATFIISIGKWSGHWLDISYMWLITALTISGVLVFASAALIGARGRRSIAETEADLAQQQSALVNDLRTLVIVPCYERLISYNFVKPSLDPLSTIRDASFPTRIDFELRVETDAFREVYALLRQPFGAVVGLAGSRGVGKSELLKAFCQDSSITTGSTPLPHSLGVHLPAPVAYKSDAFLREIVSRVAQATPGYSRERVVASRQKRQRAVWILAALSVLSFFGFGLFYRFSEAYWRAVGIALLSGAGILAVITIVSLYFSVLAISIPIFSDLVPIPLGLSGAGLSRSRRIIRAAYSADEQVKYLETLSRQETLSASTKNLAFQQMSTRSISQLPLTEPALVSVLASLIRTLNEAGFSVVIGIDELDKMVEDEKAAEFFTGLKVLFPIEHCSFLLSVSAHAWSQFARRGLPIRDVFDSSLDAVVFVNPLRLRDARRILRRRWPSISDDQVLLCHLISGGLPRELLRAARDLASLGRSRDGGTSLGNILAHAFRHDFESRINGLRSWGLAKLPPQLLPGFVSHLELLLCALDDQSVLEGLVRGDASHAGYCGLSNVGEVHPSPIPDTHEVTYELRQLFTYCYYTICMTHLFRSLESKKIDSKLICDVADELVDARVLLETDAAASWRALSGIALP